MIMTIRFIKSKRLDAFKDPVCIISILLRFANQSILFKNFCFFWGGISIELKQSASQRINTSCIRPQCASMYNVYAKSISNLFYNRIISKLSYIAHIHNDGAGPFLFPTIFSVDSFDLQRRVRMHRNALIE